jgi:hypothetical protein
VLEVYSGHQRCPKILSSERRERSSGGLRRPRRDAQAGIPGVAEGCSEYQNPFEIHTVCCRARRKRKRLSSNDPIESDAAVRSFPRPKSVASRHFR